MKRVSRPVLYMIAALALAWAWGQGLQYYAKKTNPEIINRIVKRIERDVRWQNELGDIGDIEEEFSIYSFGPDSIAFELRFEGKKKNLLFTGKAVRQNEFDTWKIVKSDSIVK